MDSFEISSDSEEGLLDEIVVGGGHNHHYPHFPKVLRMDYRQPLSHHQQQHPAVHHLQLHHLRSISQKPPSQSQSQCQRPYDPLDSPIHHCDNSAHSDDNSFGGQENQNPNQNQIHHNQQPLRPSTSSSSNLSASLDGPVGSSGTSTSVGKTMAGQLESEAGGDRAPGLKDSSIVAPVTAETQQRGSTSNHAHSNASAGALFNHQLTADMCNYKNSKSRRLEYSLKCLKYGRSNPSQDSAFGSLTDGDLSTGSSSFRLSSFQSISSPIDEGVEDIIIATTSAGNETCLELATIPTHMVSQDSAISSPCRESSPSNFLTIDDVTSGSISSGSSGSSSSGTSGSNGSNGHVRPQQFPVSLSPKILVTATTNSSSSSLASTANNGATSQQLQQQQQQQFDPPKILVNDQNSIYTTSPSKRSGTIEVFSQKYRVSSFEDMSPNKRSTATGSGSASASASGSGSGSGSAGKHLKHHSNRTAFRSLEEERRIDSAFMPIRDRTNSEHLVNMQSEKYKKLTHASFRISKTSSQVSVCAETSQDRFGSTREAGSTSAISGGGSDGGDVDADPDELSRPATASGSISSRQTMWRDSKFYRKNRIAKSNDSLLESSPNHSTRLSPSSLRDNHYDSCSSYGSAISGSRQSLNRGCSINEISGSNQALGMSLGVAINVCGISGPGFGFGSASGSGSGSGSTGNNRRYCSSKSEDLGEPNDYLRVMDARKSYSERHLLSLTTLKQTAITTTMGSNENLWLSGDEASSNEENSPHRQQWGNENMPSHHHQGRHKNQQHQQQQQQQQQQHQHQLQYHSHSHVAQPAKPHSQPHYGRPHPNHLSLSTCSINRIATTKIRTTSLATLSSHQSLANTNTSNTNTNTNFNGSAKSDNKTEGSSKASSDGDCEVDGPGTATEENSSTDESPSHLIMSGAELSRIFAADEAQGSSCSEEKTPLLDSVEMSPISPTEPDHGHDRGRGEQM